MKDATFISYAGSLDPRFFLHLAAWPAGETRRVTDELAGELDTTFPGCFTFRTPRKQPTTKPAAPAQE